MSSLSGRSIVLGVSGGIAAYKAIEVCRSLVKEGAHVVPALTEASLNFVGKSTWSALASEPAKVSLFEDLDPIAHTRLGQEADLIVVCPATARLIASYAAGISDDVLTTTLIATRAPVLLCPAMHTEMWEHPATQENIQTLKQRGAKILGPYEGPLAGGDVGMGRMAEPEEIVIAVKEFFAGGMLEGRWVLISAGGTREAVDPVRFVGNRSSGKQGIALARAAKALGAEVDLVAAPGSSFAVSVMAGLAGTGVNITNVTTAEEMHTAMNELSPKADIVVMAAAVADYRPKERAMGKIRRTGSVLTIELEPTRDILTGIQENRAKEKTEQVIVGFAAETEDLENATRQKLEKKGVDVMVGNNVSLPDAGFDGDTNEVVICSRDGNEQKVSLSSKMDVAYKVLEEAGRLFDDFYS